MKDLDQVRIGETVVVAPDTGADPLSGEGERYHDNPAVCSTDTGTEMAEGGNFQGNFLVIGEGFRVELLGRTWHGAFGVGGAIIRSGQ